MTCPGRASANAARSAAVVDTLMTLLGRGEADGRGGPVDDGRAASFEVAEMTGVGDGDNAMVGPADGASATTSGGAVSSNGDVSRCGVPYGLSVSGVRSSTLPASSRSRRVSTRPAVRAHAS